PRARPEVRPGPRAPCAAPRRRRPPGGGAEGAPRGREGPPRLHRRPKVRRRDRPPDGLGCRGPRGPRGVGEGPPEGGRTEAPPRRPLLEEGEPGEGARALPRGPEARRLVPL